MKFKISGRHAVGAFFLLLLALVPSFLLYQPGLSGGFHLDDVPNLQVLESNDVGLLAFLANTPVGGLGRPFSYLSFYLQKASYPDDPAAFLKVNLAIHLLNTALLYWLVLGLAKARSVANPALLGFMVAVLWSVLPIHVSTVLYVVQRMTLLSASFVLLACAGYAHERLRQKNKNVDWRYILRLSGWVFLGYFGVLAKENAILMGLALGLIEVFFLAPGGLTALPRWWRWLAFYAPPLAVMFYLIFVRPVTAGYVIRDFTLYERLWTEARVLWDYLKVILIPDFNDLMLYHDNYPVSRAVSWKEIVASIGLLVGVSLSWLFRHGRYASLAFGFLWFFALHLLESTFLPLEIYFEHRNYLPSVGLVVGLGFFFWRIMNELSSRVSKNVLRFLVVVVFLWMGTITVVESRSWGDPNRFFSDIWYKNPNSPRVVSELVGRLVDQGRILQAYRLLNEWSIKNPEYDALSTDVQRLYLSCLDASVPFGLNASVLRRFETGKYANIMSILQEVLFLKANGKCAHISWDDFHGMIEALLNNPRYNIDRRSVLYLNKFNALAYLSENRNNEAFRASIRGIRLEEVEFDYLLMVAAIAYQAEGEGDLYEAIMRLVEKRKPPLIFLGESQKDLLNRLEKGLQHYRSGRSGLGPKQEG